MSSKREKNRVSISYQITTRSPHGIVIFLALSCLCFVLCSKTKTDPKNCYFSRGTGLLKRRGSAENTLIINVTQSKPKHAKLTLKALGFLLPVQHWGSVFHPMPLCKIRSRHPRELKLSGLTAYVMFYNICQFEGPTITNDVIMTSLPKTMAKFGPPRNQTKYISFKSYWWELSKNVLFIEFEPLCVKFWLFLRCPLTKYGYVTCPRRKFRKFFILSKFYI